MAPTGSDGALKSPLPLVTHRSAFSPVELLVTVTGQLGTRRPESVRTVIRECCPSPWARRRQTGKHKRKHRRIVVFHRFHNMSTLNADASTTATVMPFKIRYGNRRHASWLG